MYGKLKTVPFQQTTLFAFRLPYILFFLQHGLRGLRSRSVLEFSVGGFLFTEVLSPCALMLNSMFAKYVLACPHSRNRYLVERH